MSQPQGSRPPGSNFLRHIIERDLAEGTYAARRFAGTPGDAAHHAAGAARPGAHPHALPARAERLPAHRPRQEHLPELRPGARLRRHLPPALRRHQPREGRAGVRRRDHRRRALARLRLDAPEPALGGAPTSHLYFASDYFDFMYRAAEALVERRPRLRRRAERRGDARQPRRLRHARHRQPVPQPHAGREPGAPARRCGTASSPTAPRCCARRSTWRARTSTCATRRSTASSARPTTTPATLVHLPDVHLRASDRGRAREHHAQHLHARVRGPAAVLRLAARHALQTRPAGAAAAAPVRVRAPEPHLRRHQQAQAAAAGRRGHRRRLGRPAHADDRRACAGAATRPNRSA